MRSSILFYPNYQKRSIKDQSVPIYVRTTYQGRKAEARLPFKFNDEELKLWDKTFQQFIPKELSSKLKRVNNLLGEYKSTFEDLGFSKEPETAKTMLLKSMGHKAAAGPTILSYAGDYFDKHLVKVDIKRQGTKKNYKKALTHLTLFLQKTGQQDLALAALSFELASDFYLYLLADKPEQGKAGMTESSAAGNIKKFRTIFNAAVDEDLLSKNPFLRIKLKTQTIQKRPLGVSDIRKIYQYDFSYSEGLQTCRDLFLFSAFTGLAFSDAMSLNKENIHRMPSGDIKLIKQRTKTSQSTESFLIEPVISLLERFRLRDECVISGTIVPKRSNKTLNVHLKAIASILGIEIPLSTHIARHSFRQLLAEADITDTKTINRMMGHSFYGGTNSSYGIVTDSMLQRAKNKFQAFLEEHIL